MDKELIAEIIRVLKDELQFDDDCGYTQWVMAVGIKEISKGSYLARTVIRTSDAPDYVDGTDITVNIREDQAVVDLDFLGEAPIFHGGEIASSIRWVEEVNPFCYIQSEDPFDMAKTYEE